MVRFVADGQEIFRVLKETEDGVWVIRYNNPNTPLLLSWPAMSTQMQDVEIPDDFLDESEFSPHIRKALERRMKLLAPLIEDEECITNNRKRIEKVNAIAKTCDYTPNTLDRWYFRYLAMGRVGVAPAPRHRVTNAVPPEDKENFKKAINQFYYSSKKRSQKTTYEMMLLHFYRDENQMIKERRPTYNQFLYYYKSHTSRKELESSSKGTVNDSQLIKITPEATLSLNPVQALADKREMDYLNSVRKYQLDIAAREQNYLESVQQQQQAATQREDAYTEMVLTVAAQLQQEAEKREAAYLTAAMAAAGQAQQEAEKREAERVTMAGYFTQVDTKTGQLTVN